MKKVVFILLFPLLINAAVIYVDKNSTKDRYLGTKDYPFLKVSDAVKIAKQGDTIIVKEGVYNESIVLVSGVKLKGKGRVVISGFEKIEGWKKDKGNLYKTYITRKISRLFLKNRILEISRYPEQGWLKVEKFEDKGKVYRIWNSSLKSLNLDGTEMRILSRATNSFFTCSVVEFNKEEGYIEFEKQNYLKLTEKDIFYIQNSPEFITKPGQWATVKEGEKFAVYFYPETEEDLKNLQIIGPSPRIVSLSKLKDVEIENIEVCGSNTYGLTIDNCENITVKNCIVYNNVYIGLSVKNSKNISIKNNIFLLNGTGVSVSSNVEIKNNEITLNDIDGLIVAGNVDGVNVKGNYIHHHILYGHPDNFQTWRNVKNIKFVDNLLVCGGQSIMTQETYDSEFINNIIMGSGACSLIFGHRNTDRIKMFFNTVVFSHYSCVNFTGKEYEIKGNIFVTGHPTIVYGVKSSEYNGDYNVFWTCHENTRSAVIACDGKWYRDFKEYQQNSKRDLHSIYADLMFKNFPYSFHLVDILNSTTDWLCVSDPDLIDVSDFVEINFDGVLRKVVEKKGKNIKISPPLKRRPFRIMMVCNWKDNKNFNYDFRLKENSPAKKILFKEKMPGADLNYTEMKNCDFNGDGKRDIPILPEDIEKVYREKIELGGYLGGELEKQWK